MNTNEPKLKENKVTNEKIAGITYHLEGELVPVLTVELGNEQTVYFEHHTMLWKNTTVDVVIKPVAGAVKRILAGMRIFVTQATGSGQIALSKDNVGHIIPIHIHPEEEIDVREHQFLAATSNIDYSYERVKGFANIFGGGSGFFIDKFRAIESPGVLWLYGYGNVFEKLLAEDEYIDVEPGSWLYKDASVHMETVMPKLTTGLLGSLTLTFNRFKGPGRIGIQSMTPFQFYANKANN